MFLEFLQIPSANTNVSRRWLIQIETPKVQFSLVVWFYPSFTTNHSNQKSKHVYFQVSESCEWVKTTKNGFQFSIPQFELQLCRTQTCAPKVPTWQREPRQLAVLPQIHRDGLVHGFLHVELLHQNVLAHDLLKQNVHVISTQHWCGARIKQYLWHIYNQSVQSVVIVNKSKKCRSPYLHLRADQTPVEQCVQLLLPVLLPDPSLVLSLLSRIGIQFVVVVIVLKEWTWIETLRGYTITQSIKCLCSDETEKKTNQLFLFVRNSSLQEPPVHLGTRVHLGDFGEEHVQLQGVRFLCNKHGNRLPTSM